jgi:hypothetical protein
MSYFYYFDLEINVLSFDKNPLKKFEVWKHEKSNGFAKSMSQG